MEQDGDNFRRPEPNCEIDGEVIVVPAVDIAALIDLINRENRIASARGVEVIDDLVFGKVVADHVDLF